MNCIIKTGLFAVVVSSGLALVGCQSPPKKPSPPSNHAVAAPTPVTETSSLSADALFSFGKSRLKSADNVELDNLADKLKSSQVQSVQLLGYTDRIGSDEANQKLSEQRAETVGDYLAAHGVSRNLIHTEGHGSADPVAACDNVKGRKLIACLAPNRRVEIKITTLAATVTPTTTTTTPAH